MVLVDKLAEKLFGVIKGFGHQIKLYTVDGTETVDPADARRFFSADSGLMITIDEENNEVQLSKSNSESIDKTKQLQRNVKKLANEFLMNYTVRNYGKSIQPRDFSYKAKIHRNENMEESIKEKWAGDTEVKSTGQWADKTIGELQSKRKALLAKDDRSAAETKQLRQINFAIRAKRDWKGGANESLEKENNMNPVIESSLSRLNGSKKTSHQTLENVKILVKHKKAVDEDVRGSRSRNIQAIFLEQDGERFRFPHNNLSGARAMARHMYNGGTMQDKVGGYIIESVGHMVKLKEFLRYATTNKLINEDTNDIVSAVKENVDSIRAELHRLSGTKTYESIKSRIEEQEDMDLQESDIDSLRDMFTVKRFDEKFDEVLPIVNRLVQEKTQFLRRIEEAASSEIYVAPASASSIGAIFEFANDEAKLGHKISDLSSRIIENSELASYVGKVGQKLCKEGKISAFEQEIVASVLNNLRPQPIAERKSIQESTDYEAFFDKYLYAGI
jgi:hypothetical protein